MLREVPRPRYDTVEVREGLGDERAFEYLDRHHEPLNTMHMLSHDTVRTKASSNVILIELWDWADLFTQYVDLKCRAGLENDTLRISLTHSTGFSGAGVTIRVVGGRFHAKNYRYTDVEIEGEQEPVVTVEKQKLTLNKREYRIGDKIFGQLYLKTIGSDSIRAYAQGFFRATVEKAE